MKRWYLISAVSVILTLLMVALWLLIPGFPLLIFFLFPPIFLWGSRRNEEGTSSEEQLSCPTRKLEYRSTLCQSCRKTINLEPDESYCPNCGERIRAFD